MKRGGQGSGNSCGHDPEHPRWFEPPPEHAPRPGILRRLISQVREYFFHPDRVLPALNASNGSTRRQRSERRESCLAVLGAILHYTDLATLRVGIPGPTGILSNLTVPVLAARAGIGERRAERAMRDLKAAGLITVQPRYRRRPDGSRQGLAAVRTVSPHLFGALGLERWLAHERRKAADRRHRREEKQRRKAAAQTKMATVALTDTFHGRASAGLDPRRPGAGSGLPKTAATFFADFRRKFGRGPPG